MTDTGQGSAVTYVGLPVASGGAHSLGRMSRRVAHERTLHFIKTCTEPIGQIRYWFPPFTGGVNSASRVADALDYLDRIDPQPTNAAGMAAVWLTLECAFRLLDPATGRALPGQDPERYFGTLYERDQPLGSSRLTLSLHNRADLSIDLCIPDAGDETLGRMIPWLQEHLPFKMSSRQWKAWTPTVVRSFKGRKISVSRWLT